MLKKWAVRAMLAACVLSCIFSLMQNRASREQREGSWKNQVGLFLSRAMERAFIQIPGYLRDRGESVREDRVLEGLIRKRFPFLNYSVLYGQNA